MAQRFHEVPAGPSASLPETRRAARPPRGFGTGAALFFAAGLIYALGLQMLMQPLAIDGFYFQEWSSEDMMQTVSLQRLREKPLVSLWHIHIEPPAFDAARALLALPWRGTNDAIAQRGVDRSLYIWGAVLVGVLAATAYSWMAHYGRPVAVAGTTITLLHPAVIFFATFLDTTLLTAVLVLALYYSLWRVKNGEVVPVSLLAFLALALFFCRSAFQWPALVVIALSLYLLGFEHRKLMRYIAVTGVIAGAFLLKQQAMFGILSTSSFTGINLANSIGVGLGTERYETYLSRHPQPSRASASMPAVLTDMAKPNDRPNFNHIDYLDLNAELLGRYAEAMRSTPPGELLRSYLENAFIYFMPSSSYGSSHVITERLPWLPLYERTFSAPVLPLLLFAALVAWVFRLPRRQSIAKNLGILLPGMYILAVCIFSDKGENMRFKFWLEPVMIIFLFSQLHGLAARLRAQPRRGGTAAALPEG